MNTPPLKRHPALQPLSREHFNGLVQARRLMQAADAAAEERRRLIAGFEGAWRSEIVSHFDDEERLLTHLVSPQDASRLHAEHRQIRAIANEVLATGDGIDPGRLRLLGRLLHDHIRWEERSLFPEVEAAAGERDMERIAARTREVEAQRPGARRRGDLRPGDPGPGDPDTGD